MDEKTRNRLIQLAEKEIPIHKFLGLKVEALRQDYIQISVPFKPEVVGDVRKNRWHGGLIATIMDTVGGAIGVAHFRSDEDQLATIDLRVDYLHGAKAETLYFEGRLVRLGNRILVTKMKAYQGEVLVAEGKGVYNLTRAESTSRA